MTTATETVLPRVSRITEVLLRYRAVGYALLLLALFAILQAGRPAPEKARQAGAAAHADERPQVLPER